MKILTLRRVKENMTILCKKFFPNEFAVLQNSLIGQPLFANPSLRRAVTYIDGQEAEEEEEDETQREESEEEDEDNKTSNQYSLDIDDEWDDNVTLVDEDRRRPSAGGLAAN